MNNRDLIIRDRLQKDKQISDKADKIFNNFKEEFKLENNEGRKVIKISFSKFLAIAASFVIILFLGVGLYTNKLKENKSKLDIQAEQKDEPKVPEIILDKEWEKDNIKLKYPSDWNLTNNESYAETTVLAAPGDNDDEKAKLYITINENTGNRSAKEIIEEATSPDYGVPTKTIGEGEKDIASVKAYYKTQSMSYDDGSNWDSTTIILIKDIFMYEFKFTGIEDEYNSYYPVFDQILDSIEFIHKEESEDEINMSKIEITREPTKKVYKAGENFDKTGMIVTATYSDGSKRKITDYKVADGENLEVGQKSVLIHYTEGDREIEAIQSITVMQMNLDMSKIEITKEPTKKVYKAGDSFDKTGMIVTATYSDGSKREITNYKVANGEELEAGQKSVLIHYTDGDREIEAIQSITVK